MIRTKTTGIVCLIVALCSLWNIVVGFGQEAQRQEAPNMQSLLQTADFS
jgi:hypothetical protein